MSDNEINEQNDIIVFDFSIDYVDSALRKATVYSNGYNQVPVVISLRLKKNDEQYKYSQEELFKRITLHHRHTDVELSKRPNYIGLHYSGNHSRFTKAVSYEANFSTDSPIIEHDDPETTKLILYVSSCDVSGGEFEFYARISIPENMGQKKYDSDSESFKKTLAIHALPKINYNDRNNWVVDISEPWNVVTKELSVSSKQKGWIGDWHDNSYTATSRYKKIYIRSLKYQESKGVLKLFDRKVNGGVRPVHGSEEPDFVIEPHGFDFSESRLSGWPSAIIGISSGSYDVLGWWVEPGVSELQTHDKKIGIENGSKIYLEAFNHRYIIFLGESDQGLVNYSDMSEECITVYLWNIQFDMDDTYKEGWGDKIKLARVSVVDSFGNAGELKIKFSGYEWVPVLD